MDAGYLNLEFDQLTLAVKKQPAKDLVLRVDAEFINGYDVFKWATNKETKFSSGKFTPVPSGNSEVPSEPFVFVNGFNELSLRTVFLDLNSEVLNGLVNASLKITVLQINEADAAAPAAKPAKGAAPVAAVPQEEALWTLTLSLAELVQASGGVLRCASPHSEAVVNANVEGSETTLAFTLTADNTMAEYVVGATVLRWTGASLRNAPAQWGLHAADVIDPKAKVQPTADDLRNKYVENIGKLVDSQEKVAVFSLSVGGEGANGESSFVQQTISKLSLKNGVIAFDKAVAATVPVSEDIRARAEVWSLTWGQSPAIFLHRADIRKLVSVLQKDSAAGLLPLTIKKSPTNEYTVAEGGEVFATALVDVSAVLAHGTREWAIAAPLTGAEFTDEVPYDFSVTLTSGAVLCPKPAVDALADKISANTISYGSTQPVVAPKTVSIVDNNKNALQSLRDDITKSIERIAQEYLSLYPLSDENRAVEEGVPTPKPLEGKKLEFLNYLTSNGIFNELKEHLKASVETIIRDQYGDRGRGIRADETNYDQNESIAAQLEAVLSELYVFLMKECTVVLNSLFSDTLIDRSKQELETSASIRDEEETLAQQLGRLSNWADDCSASGAFEAAEQLHLECLHLMNHSPSLGSNLDVVHEVYRRYGEFLLGYFAACLRRETGTGSTEVANGIILRARDALYSAVCAKTSNWRVVLIYAAVLVEVGQSEQAESLLHQVLSVQLAEGQYGLGSFSDFDGYESDRMCPVDPRCYSVLGALFSLQGDLLKCRKALRLANRSFAEGGFQPPVTSHGSPRRTIVLTLADTAVFLFELGLRKLGDECLKLSLQSEADVSEKINARGKLAFTVPHIKHLLKRAQAQSLVFRSRSQEDGGVSSGDAEERALEAVLSAEDPVDQLTGWLTVAAAVGAQDTPKSIEAFLSAVEKLNEIPLSLAKSGVFPLSAFVQLGKLLVSSGRYKEASTVLMYGCAFYSSASLFQLLGVCYLRLELLQEAEEALMASSTLNNRSPELWAYFCLLNLAVGVTRRVEAERCMKQALRLGLTDVLLLREMATAYIAIDKLQTAEDLIRRALVTDKRDADLFNKKSGGLTRRLLGDVLAGQNQAVRAIEEYQAILSDESIEDNAFKLETAQKCANLLFSIGREEEVAALRNIMASIPSQ